MLNTWRGVLWGCLAAFILGGCATTGNPGSASSNGISVQKVEQIANPCDEQVQRTEKFKQTAGSAILGALACTGAALVFDALKGGGNLSAGDYAKVAAACAALGAMYGYNKASDSLRRQCELYRIAEKKKLDTRYELVTIKAPVQPAAGGSTSGFTRTEEQVASVTTLSGMGHFVSGSAKLTPRARTYFQQMARQYSEAVQIKSLQRTVAEQQQAASSGKPLSPEEKAKREGAAQSDAQRMEQLKKDWSALSLVIIGHTDDTGNPKKNMALSEKRSRAVAAVFRKNGVSVDRIYYQGAGASFPVADNRTASGRAKNRRVEIVELPPGADVSRYLSLRRPNPAFYRPKPKLAVTKPASIKEARKSIPSGSHSKSGSVGVTPPPVLAKKTYRKPVVARKMGGEELDFGGVLAGADEPDLLSLMGGVRPGNSRSWGFINVAVADETVYQVPCIRDDPERYDSLPVKGLANDRPVSDYKTGEFMPGLYNTAWADTVNGHYVAFKGLAVTRDGRAVSAPEALVYKDYANRKKTAAGKPLRAATRVTTVEGNKGLLYRMYMGEGAVMRCVDLILPYKAPYAAMAGQMYYDRNGAVREIDIHPKKVTKQK